MGAFTYYIDLLLTNQTTYAPSNSSKNMLSGQFAQINLACNERVNLRVATMRSCANRASCKLCNYADTYPTVEARTACYSAGCSCFGTTVFSEADCSGAAKESHRANYDCLALNMPLVLPSGSMITMTVYDFDTGPDGDYVEQLTVPGYAYYKTPLKSASGAAYMSSTIAVDEAARTFNATARGSDFNNPTDPKTLSDNAAVRGVQFFFQAQYGYVEAEYAVYSETPRLYGS